ncbi:hypothetical protein GGI15_001850, partial [Coemansia interrupta]
MLSFAASARVRTTVADSAKRRLPHITRAAYHAASPHGSPLLSGGGGGGRGKWTSKLVSFLRKGFAAAVGTAPSRPPAAARSFLHTAAGRLAAKSPRTMLHRITARLGAHAHLKTLLARLSHKMHLVPGASRLAARASNPRSWVFASGGRWHPYLRTFANSLRTLSGPKNIASARVVMAQLQRQAIVVSSLSQQRRDLSSASPLSHGTKIAIQGARSRPTPAAAGFAAKASPKAAAAMSASPAAAADAAAGHRRQTSQQLHPVAKSAQDAAAVPIEQCVTITVPYTISSAAQNQPGILSDVAQLISDVQRIQQRHSLLLSRLTERLAASGWNIQYRHISTPTESIQIALPPSSGILTAAACEDLLCEWGFDLSLFAATIRNPVEPPAQPLTPLPGNVADPGASPGAARASAATTYDSDDIDSRLFSLIVDQIVDPEEAYREEVRDFLTQIEQMPRLDTVRLWSLDIAKGAGSRTLAKNHLERRRSSALSTAADTNSEPAVISTIAEKSAEPASHSIHEIACLSWANDGSTYVVGGSGSSCIRQYSNDGTHIQDIKLNTRSERASLMDIVSVHHYGSKSESLFVANNSVRQVRRWDFVKKDYTATCQTHTNDISCMAVSTKKRLVVSATSQGGEIAVFNLLHNTRSDLRSATQRSLTCLDISSSHHSQIAVGSEDGLLQLFDNARSAATPVKTYSSVHLAPVRGIAFHPINHSVIISVGLDGRIIATDSNAYLSSGVNGISNNHAINIDAGAPLTCLTASSDPFAVGAGTIDGDVLIFDMRAARSPLWRSSVGVRRAVTSLNLSECSDSAWPDGATDTLRYSQSKATSQQDDGLSSTSYVGSVRGDTMADIFSNDRRRSKIFGLGKDFEANGDGAVFRPPRHPAIDRYRIAAGDSTPNQSLTRGTPRFSLSRSADPATKSDAARPPLYLDEKLADDDDMVIVDENASIMRNDRSFMDLLSPEKAVAKTAYGARKAALDSNRENFLTTLSRNRGHAVAPSATNPRIRSTLLSKEPSWLTRTTGKAGTAKTPGHSKTPYDRDFARSYSKVSTRASMLVPSPIPKPAEPAKHDEPADPSDPVGHIQNANTHDTGDSMVEMFTPERKKPAATDSLFLIPEADEDKDDGASGSGPGIKSNARASRHISRPAGDPDTPVASTQPLPERRKRDSLLTTVSATSTATESVGMAHPTLHSTIEPRRQSNVFGKTRDTLAISTPIAVPTTSVPSMVLARTPAKTPFKSPGRIPLEKYSPFQPPQSRIIRSSEKKAKTPALLLAKSAVSPKPDQSTAKPNGKPAYAAPAAAHTAALATVHTLAADSRQSAPAPAPAPEPKSTPTSVQTGLNAVSSNVFQNLVSDALLPLREQLSGEIRNLHLDMIRQDFVYQEQMRALRAECSEARALRREIDQLRRENEQLKR